MIDHLTLFSPYTLASLFAVAVGASLLGTFMILRRMALVADAFSHVALPGIAAGILLGFAPFLGALALLVFGFFAMSHFELKRHAHPETTLGVIFTTALAVGALLIPDEKIIESLFGSIETLSFISAVLAMAGGAAVTALLISNFRNFSLLTLSPELAQSSDVNVARTNHLFFFTLALTVALGIQFVGVLLAGALIVLPAAAAKNIAASFRSMTVLAVAFGIAGAYGGLFAAQRWSVEAGPAVVLVLAVLFLITLFFKKRI